MSRPAPHEGTEKGNNHRSDFPRPMDYFLPTKNKAKADLALTKSSENQLS
jgi:hypothetical protein